MVEALGMGLRVSGRRGFRGKRAFREGKRFGRR
jgi:hypothetical protein